MRNRTLRIVQRLLAAVPVTLAVVVLAFLFLRLIPGDPVDILLGSAGTVGEGEVERMRAQLGLDRPLLEQLGRFLIGLTRGDLGQSFVRGRPVMAVLGEALPATIELAGGALLLALLIGLPVGVLSAVWRNSRFDRLAMAASYLGISMPQFWLGIVAIALLSVGLGWFPSSGRLEVGMRVPWVTGMATLDALLAGDWAAFGSALRHLFLPAMTLSLAMAAIVARVVRSSLIETLAQDYVTLARAKGLSETWVVVRHALRNALLPTVTVIGLQVGVLLGGNMIVETVFGWPGLGTIVVSAIRSRDYPLVQGAVMVYALTFVVVNLAVDVLYTVLNPKIQI